MSNKSTVKDSKSVDDARMAAKTMSNDVKATTSDTTKDSKVKGHKVSGHAKKGAHK